jgi:phage baseplate assembly protein W
MAIKNITVQWPLKISPQGYIEPITEENIGDAVKFNLKNILLTIPGEKLSDADFGVGLIRYLFLNNNEDLKPLKSEIRKQIKRYFNVFSSLTIDVNTSQMSEQILKVKLTYVVDQIKLSDELEVEVSL